MNRLKHNRLALLLAVFTLLIPLSACKVETVATAAPTLTLEEDGKLRYTVLLDAATLAAHGKDTAYLYELAPGETAANLSGKTSVASSKVTSSIRMELPSEANGVSRLYNSYLLAFSDGTLLSDTPVFVSNVTDHAKNKDPLPHAAAPKGLNVGRSELAVANHAYRAVAELSLADLLAGDGFLASFGGTDVMLDSARLAELDSLLADAAAYGRRVTLHLELDTTVTTAQYLAIVDTLLSRYTADAFGCVADLSVGIPELENDRAIEEITELLRLSHLALRSRVAEGRLYLGLGGRTDYVKFIGSQVVSALRKGQRFDLGVALMPLGEVRRDGKLALSDLPAVAEYLSQEIDRNLPVAVIGLEIDSRDDMGAALYTYAYRASILAKAELICYRHAVSDAHGLYGADFAARPILSAFSLADTEKNTYGEALAAEKLGEAWTSLKAAKPQRTLVDCIANSGATERTNRRLLDFTDSEKLVSFSPRGRASQPEIILSSGWGENVLVSSLRPDLYGIGSGYTATLPDSRELARSRALSANLLAQTSLHPLATVTLLLEGSAEDGSPLSCRSSIEVATNDWQTVTFHIREFSAKLDPDAPCRVSLIMETETNDREESYSLFLHSLNTAGSDSADPLITVLLIAMGGFTVGVLAVLLPSRLRRRRK